MEYECINYDLGTISSQYILKYVNPQDYLEISTEHVNDEKSFIAGAKWMQERMYSEEDMIKFSEWVSLNFPNQHNYLRALQKYNQGLDVPKEKLIGYYSTKELFEQFKKK